MMKINFENLRKFEEAGVKNVESTLKQTSMMEVSFTRGTCMKVKVLGLNLMSNNDDVKYDVEVVETLGNGLGVHEVGHKRWVRAYNLKNIGTYVWGVEQ